MRALLLAAAFSGAVFAQDAVNGPMLGWIQEGESVRAILGVPGASTVGARNTQVAWTQVAICSERGYALGVSNGQVLLADLNAGSTGRAIEGLPDGAQRVVLSPTGAAAVVVYEESRRLVLLNGLPANAAVAAELPMAAQDAPGTVAVSDDASMVLAAFGGEFWVIESGNSWKPALEGTAHGVIFIDQSRTALIAASSGLWRLEGASLTRLWGGSLRSVLVTANGATAVAADAERNVLLTVDLATGNSAFVESNAPPAGLRRLNSGNVFLINDGAAQPYWLLDLASNEPRMVFVPAAGE